MILYLPRKNISHLLSHCTLKTKGHVNAIRGMYFSSSSLYNIDDK